MSNSFIQALLMDDPQGVLPPPAPTCVPDSYYTCGPTADPHWNDVVLLAPFDTDNSDLSTTGVVFTNTGTSITTTQKKFGAGSLSINGAGANKFLRSDDQAALYLDGDFTVEFWVRATSLPFATLVALIEIKETATDFVDFSIQSSTSSAAITFNYRTNDGGSTTASSTGTTKILGVQVWTHVALTRSGSTLRLFVGGTLVSTITSAYIAPTGDRYIVVGNNTATANRSLNGQIDDLRVTNGTCRYFGNFIVPTTASPSSLDTTWVESDPRTIAILHFQPPTETVVMNVAGTVDASDSVTYDGEVATATVLDATAVSYGAGGITFIVDNSDNSIILNATSKLLVERYREVRVSCTMTWAGTPAGTGSNFNFLEWGFGVTLPAFGFAFGVTAGVPNLTATGYDSANNSVGITGAVPVTAVYEVRFIANGTIQWFIDGVEVRKYAASGNRPYLPRDGIKIGATARGTDAGITSVTIKDVVVNLVDFADSSCYQPKYIEYRGTAAISAAESKFGGYAVSIPGSGSSVSRGVLITANQDFLFGANPWTIELWAYRIDNSQEGRLLTGLYDIGGRILVGTDGLVDIQVTTNVDTVSSLNTVAWPLGQWNHVVLQRTGDDVEFYLNGVLEATIALTAGATMDCITDLYIGWRGSSFTDTWNGYVDESRITKGVARYNGNFSLATLPNCNGDDPGGGLPVSGTEYPTSVTAEVQQGSMTLLNHYQPLTGQSATVVQGFAADGIVPYPITPTLTYTSTSKANVIQVIPLSVQIESDLIFNNAGGIAFFPSYEYSTGPNNSGVTGVTNSAWLDRTDVSGAGDNYEIRLTPSYNILFPPPATSDRIAWDFSASGTAWFNLGNTWNQMNVSRVIPLYKNFDRANVSQTDFLDILVEVRPTAASGLVGGIYEKTYTLRIYHVAVKFTKP